MIRVNGCLNVRSVKLARAPMMRSESTCNASGRDGFVAGVADTKETLF